MKTPQPLQVFIHPSLCVPPHRITHPNKYEELVEQFLKFGWNETKPDLVGYPVDEGKIQFITGSHRWAAAEFADVLIPAKIYSFEYIRTIWGTGEWVELIKENTYE